MKNKQIQRSVLGLGLLLPLLLSSVALASTQHYIGTVSAGTGAEATVVSTQISYISPRPPVGQPEMYEPGGARMFVVDGWFTDRETFLAAVRPGQRLHLRNNRSQPVFYGLYSTPAFAAEGIIEEADPATRTVTVRHMTDRKQRFTTTQQFTLPEDGVLRYEGVDASAEAALQPGRHLRAHAARKQTVLGITPEAHLDTMKKRFAAWDLLERPHWVNEGWFAGHDHGHLFYTGESLREGGGHFPIQTSQPGASVTTSLFTALTLINGNFISSSAALRPGERALFVPDPIHSNRKVSHIIFQPKDDGHVEGRIVRVEGDQVELEVSDTPTGRVRDFRTERVTVEIDGDAVFHLNGLPDAPRAEVLQKGNTLRVLPAWSGAMLVRDLDPERAKISGYGLANRASTTRHVLRSEESAPRISLHFGQTLFSPLNPAQYVDASFILKDGEVNELKVFSERFPGEWRVKDTDAHLDIAGDRFTGWVEGHFSGDSISGYGVPGLYRFEIEGHLRNQVLDGEITRRTVDGVDHLEVPNENVGPLDPRVGGVMETGPATSDPALYRIRIHGLTPHLDPVVHLRRRDGEWGTGIATYDQNRRTDLMEVDPSGLEWTPDGPAGPLRIHLAPALLKNESKPEWRTYHLSAGEARGAGAFDGSYRAAVGEDPFLYFGPEGRVIQPD